MSLDQLLNIPTVEDFLLDDGMSTTLEEVLTKYGLPYHRWDELVDLTSAVLDEELPLDQMPALIAQAFGVDEKIGQAIAADVAGYRLYPLRDFVPDVAEYITKWGKRPQDYPQKRIGKAKVTTDRLASELSEKHGLEFSEVLIKRMGFLIKGYFDGSKTRESTLTFFSRQPSIGGLGVSGEKGQEVLDDVDSMRRGIELVDREEEVHEETQVLSAPKPSTYLEVAPSHEVTVEVPVVSGAVFKKSVEKEVLPAVKDVKAAKQMQTIAAPVKDKLESAVSSSVEAAAVTLQTKRIAKKAFADIARAAIRGLRDLYQTREILERDFALTGVELETLTEAIERGHAMYHAQGQDVQSPEQVQTNDLTDVFQVSAARTKAEEVELQASKITPKERAEAEIAARPMPVTPKLTVGSVPPSQPGQQAVVTDIRPTTRLMGPIEQLGSMTSTEFRRLSTSPSDAVQKIEDLLLSLERQSYEERIKGVKAWRQSPVNQLYLGMASQALKDGIAIAEVASRRRAAGEESLSPAEIRAISGLNGKLRY